MTAKIEKLKNQKAKIDAKIQLLQAREKSLQRKQDTRRKILIGAFILDKAIKENTVQDLFKSVTDFLTRDSDKSLFVTGKNNDTIDKYD